MRRERSRCPMRSTRNSLRSLGSLARGFLGGDVLEVGGDERRPLRHVAAVEDVEERVDHPVRHLPRAEVVEQQDVGLHHRLQHLQLGGAGLGVVRVADLADQLVEVPELAAGALVLHQLAQHRHRQVGLADAVVAAEQQAEPLVGDAAVRVAGAVQQALLERRGERRGERLEVGERAVLVARRDAGQLQERVLAAAPARAPGRCTAARTRAVALDVSKPVPPQSSHMGVMSLCQVAAQALGRLVAAQLLLGLALDLADAFAREAQRLADLAAGCAAPRRRGRSACGSPRAPSRPAPRPAAWICASNESRIISISIGGMVSCSSVSPSSMLPSSPTAVDSDKPSPATRSSLSTSASVSSASFATSSLVGWRSSSAASRSRTEPTFETWPETFCGRRNMRLCSERRVEDRLADPPDGVGDEAARCARGRSASPPR